jgi:1,4-alpha-glucan branching enzyme
LSELIAEWERYSTLNHDEIQSILTQTCYDPFSILGVHPLETDLGQKTVIRVFHPTAAFINGFFETDDGREHFDLMKLGNLGFFEGILDREFNSDPYTLSIHTQSGHRYNTRDPYGFSPVLSEFDIHLLCAGNHYEMYNKLGANIITHQEVSGVHFAVWAPSARGVSVVGHFNSWDGRRHPLRQRGASGIWEIFLPHVQEGELYKFEIFTQSGQTLIKSDPLAKSSEMRPSTASKVAQIYDYKWNDEQWMWFRNEKDAVNSPVNIYEVHLGSWQRDPQNPDRFFSYTELAERLIPYVVQMGYTHIELLPVAEHPLDESWGYQVTGYFAATSRFGSPKDFMHFVDVCHQNGIGIILDWVPAHFPKDAHGLGRFDGTALYEHEDSRKGEHPDWGTYIFNYGRTEVSNFLISNALYWLKEFHIDGLRVDAVASMLYLDYGKTPGNWIPNQDGGNINYEAIEFMKHLGSIVRKDLPGCLLIAEESTSYPAISRAPEEGGLGYHFKWNMGWMNDFLSYLQMDPVHRKYHHNLLTFSMIYAYSEHFILVLSHDEVVHGKRSMLSKMPGDDWQKFANLRLAYGFLYGHPGKKLLFMGSEFGQYIEWNPKQSLDWHLTNWDPHRKLTDMVRNINHIYKDEKAFWELDSSPEGFEWIDCDDADQSIVSFIRKSKDPNNFILIVSNFTPVVRHNYRVGVPRPGRYQEIFNTDSSLFGGSNVGNLGEKFTEDQPWQRRPVSLMINIPPLSVVYFKFQN